MENEKIFNDYLRKEIKHLESELGKIEVKITKENSNKYADYNKLNKLLVERENIRFSITKLYQLIGGLHDYMADHK